ncbi:hypothetical protein [Bradyrhizobium australafricanum]|uniref:hypothetical protein n=1 Tax=Bradyrhizobium australafricanum TaxID=2821406 RepID=UPI001CE2D194|nr:hypothetical protein [Bradyrhizobium australafricanum]MCA6105351.1 hypothetical protein [Bradyrhizobium australafricanum]
MASWFWKPEEDEVIRTSSFKEARHRLPHRTPNSIGSRRRLLRVGITRRPWTEGEKRRIIRHAGEPLDILAKRFKGRTKSAVKHQHALLVGCIMRPVTTWKMTEITKLRQMWPTARRPELEAAFPNRTWGAIKVQAEKHGWRKNRPLLEYENELRNAIRTRAREDGIGLAKLGAETQCGTYFLQNRATKLPDLNKIGRAVEFFGGRLVIDWQDE